MRNFGRSDFLWWVKWNFRVRNECRKRPKNKQNFPLEIGPLRNVFERHSKFRDRTVNCSLLLEPSSKTRNLCPPLWITAWSAKYLLFSGIPNRKTFFCFSSCVVKILIKRSCQNTRFALRKFYKKKISRSNDSQSLLFINFLWNFKKKFDRAPTYGVGCVYECINYNNNNNKIKKA